MTSICIPDSVVSIGWGALSGCNNLAHVTLPFIGAKAEEPSDACIGYIFMDSPFSADNSHVPPSLKTVVMTGGTSIRSGAFRGCTGLTDISIPNSVTSIGDGAFSGCIGLTGVTIPDSVTSIGNHAFYCCSGLTNISVPDSVVSIGDGAFGDCTGLKSITISNRLSSIGIGSFYNCTKLRRITYQGTKAEWETVSKGNLKWFGTVVCTDGTIEIE